MIIYKNEIQQNSDEWLKLRSQYITGTDAYDLLNGKTIQEILDHKQNQKSWGGNYYTKRGHDLEPEAKEIYSEVYAPTYDMGFVINDKYPYCGVSPDGLVGDDGIVEVKAFNEKRHFDVFKNLDPHIIAQTQYQLFVTERDWVDLVLYNPDIKDLTQALLVRRLTPIKSIQDKLHDIFIHAS